MILMVAFASAGLTGLRWLDLVSAGRLEESALVHLQPLRRLHFLDIGPFMSLSDQALNALHPLQLLQRICLRICRQVSTSASEIHWWFLSWP